MGIFDYMKKIDLHCHMDGSLSVETIRKLAANLHQELPPEEELVSRMQVGHDCRDLNEYLSCFSIPLPYLCTRQNFQDAVSGVMKDAAREGVVYMELRFSPLMSSEEDLSFQQMIEGAISGLEEGKKLYGMEGGLILCGMRHLPAEENLRMLQAGKEYYGAGVCAVDMAGNEAAYPILLQREFFQEARRLGIPFTIHAGECGSAESVRAAVGLGAARIGHGIAAWQDEELMKECRKAGIAFEMCPISNLQTRASTKEEYPFLKFREAGLNLTINTDNRMVSGTSLTQEFEWLQEMYRITVEDARILTMNALDAAFAGDDVKHTVWKRLTGHE